MAFNGISKGKLIISVLVIFVLVIAAVLFFFQTSAPIATNISDDVKRITLNIEDNEFDTLFLTSPIDTPTIIEVINKDDVDHSFMLGYNDFFSRQTDGSLEYIELSNAVVAKNSKREFFVPDNLNTVNLTYSCQLNCPVTEKVIGQFKFGSSNIPFFHFRSTNEGFHTTNYAFKIGNTVLPDPFVVEVFVENWGDKTHSFSFLGENKNEDPSLYEYTEFEVRANKIGVIKVTPSFAVHTFHLVCNTCKDGEKTAATRTLVN